MIRGADLKGVVAMMPAFTTPDGDSPTSKDTINTAELEKSVDKIIRDGVDAVATTGSFGECHTLLWEEFRVLVESTVSAVRKRVPLFIGCTTTNTRETMRQIGFAQDAGADGVLCGVPFYFPSTVENAVQFYLDLADAFPKMGIALYHNPSLHRVTIPISAYKQLITRPNIVAAKDAHRHGIQCVDLMKIVKGKIAIFCNQNQCYPNMMSGADGCWSISVWAGPWPVLRLRDACFAGDWEAAKNICSDLNGAYKAPGKEGDRFWRENSHKLTINEAGYCYAGPLRPPFRRIPNEIIEHAKQQAESWKKLCQKYGPQSQLEATKALEKLRA
jgi:hydratase-aldolase